VHPFILLCVSGVLSFSGANYVCAAEKLDLTGKKDAKKEEKENLAWMEAGKAEAKATFARQAAQAPKPGSIPLFIGEYLWSGRADDKYKPFFMWELRLQGAVKELAEAKYRIVTLTPDRKPMTTGEWATLGTLSAEKTRDLSYKLNCPTFQAFHIELQWKGGTETYIVWDKVATVPVALSTVKDQSFLISFNQLFEYDKSKKATQISYMLWNIGGVAAKDTVQTLIFKDAQGKQVGTYDHRPNKGEVPAFYVGEQKISASKIPPFENFSIGTKTTDLSTLDPGKFTNAKDIEIAEVSSEENNKGRVPSKVLKAKVRNGLDKEVSDLVVTLNLIDRNGKLVKRLDIPVGNVASHQIVPISADISEVKSWAGYEVSWRVSNLTTVEQTPKRAVDTTNENSAPIEMEVDGLVFVLKKNTMTNKGVEINGMLRSKRAETLSNVVLSFIVPEKGKPDTVVTLKPGTLAEGAEIAVNFLAEGVTTFSGLSLKWISLKQ
jgi:hypothetical protein